MYPTNGTSMVGGALQPPIAKPPAEAGVPRNLQNMRHDLESLGKSVETLRERLSPILKAPEPASGQNVANAPSVDSPAALCLQELRSIVDHIHSVVEDIHRRLDV